jgi:glycosyltransferase involved in cell wall biosynthesis
MRIAVVHTVFASKGGGERFVYEVFKRLSKFHEIHLFCNDITPDTFNFKEFEHTIIPSRHDAFGKFVAYYEAKALGKVIKAAVEWKPDIIWLNRGYYYVGWIKKNYGIRTIPYVHYPVAIEPRKSNWIRDIYRQMIGLEKLESASFAEAPIVLCNSNYTKSVIMKIQPSSKVHVVYPGIDHKRFFPTWEDGGYLYYNSRFQPIKNQALALDVARETGYELILSGFVSAANANYFDSIKKRADKLKVKIVQNPTDEEIVKLLQRCSIFLFPSIGEHFGIAPIEAMACGKPVVGHNSGGTVETVGEAGILCGDDLQDWVKVTKYLMDNDDVRREMGRKAFEFSEKFAWDKTSNEIVRVLEEVA